MPWIKDIADDVVALVKCVPVKARIFYVGLIIVLGFGLLYFMEIHKFQIQMAQLEKPTAQPSPENKSFNTTRILAGGIENNEPKTFAKRSK